MGGPDPRGLSDAQPDLVRGVRAALDGHLAEGATLVVGVSGGPDSVALLHLLAAARPDLALVVGHVRHGLRDDAADAEAAMANAAVLGVPVEVLPVDVGEGEGPEDAARRSRLHALTSLAREVGAAGVALGHTADDQAETLLLRLARGTGLDGLSGMAVAVPRDGVLLLRPLLGLRRASVHTASDGWPTVADPTNAGDPDQRRGRARREAMPALGRLRPDAGDPVPALARLADLVGEDAALLAAVAAGVPAVARALSRPPHRHGRVVVVPDAGLDPRDAGHRALLRRRLRHAWTLLPLDGGGVPPLAHRPPPSARSVEEALGLAPGDHLTLPAGVMASRTAADLVLRDEARAGWPPVALPVGRPVTVPHLGLTYTLHRTPPAAERRSRVLAVAEPASGADGIVVRPRHADGERAIRRALQRHPAPLRDQVPVVAAADSVLLVGGEVVSPPAPDGRALWIAVDGVPDADGGYPAAT